MLSTSTVAINKLRVSGHHGDPLALRLRLDRVLSATDLTPRGVPSTAIVCFKRLRDPRPGLLDLASRSLHSSFVWEQALKEHLANLVARAPRSASERNVALNAECVIFLDQADLLASLASDWCRGQIESRWWWRALLRSSIVGRELLAMWKEAAEHVPAALEKLGPQLNSFVTKLSEVEADELLTAVVRRFAVEAIAPLIGEAVAPSEIVFDRAPEVRREDRVVQRWRSPVVAPWRHYVRETREQPLTLAQERFVGVSLMLLRAPAIVRTRKFAIAVAQWQHERVAFAGLPVRVAVEQSETTSQTFTTTDKRLPHTPAQEHPAFVTPSPKPEPTPQTLTQESVASDPIRFAISEPAHPSVKFVSKRPREIKRPSKAPAVFEEPAVERTVEHELKPDLLDEHKVIPVQGISAKSAVNTNTEHVEVFETSVSEPVLEARAVDNAVEVETNFAGVFYLVNLGIYLGLYGDFTMPAEPGIELNIWDFVALIGRELIGAEIENDGVWSLLADLAGREDELEKIKSENEVWLADMMPKIRDRLRSALGLDENTDPGPLLIAHSGRVRVTATHVDVFLLLAELPIAIRFAGLDRDPGWVPAAGRYIAFHFQ